MRPLWSYGVFDNSPIETALTVGGCSVYSYSLPSRARERLGGAMPTDLLDLLEPPGRRSGCWPHDGEVAGGAVASSF